MNHSLGEESIVEIDCKGVMQLVSELFDGLDDCVLGMGMGERGDVPIMCTLALAVFDPSPVSDRDNGLSEARGRMRSMS